MWWSNQWAKGVLTDPQKWKGEYGWLLPVKKGTFVPSKYHQIFSNINTHPYIWPDFWKPYRQIDLFRPTVYFRPKTISKVAIINKSATIAFFSSPPFWPSSTLMAENFARFGKIYTCINLVVKLSDESLSIRSHFLIGLAKPQGWQRF